MMGASIMATLMGSVAPLFMLQMVNIDPERIARGIIQTMVIGARAGMDLRYGGILYDENTMGVSLRDVTLVPPAGAGLNDCTVTIEAMTLTPTIGDDVSGIEIEADGVEATPGCAAEGGMVAVAMLGPDVLSADRLSIDLDYEVGQSALSMTAYLQTARTGTIDLAVEASGLHMTSEPVEMDETDGMDSGSSESLAGTLDFLEVTIDDVDHLRDMMPMLGVGDDAPEQAVAFLGMGLGDVAGTPAGKALTDSAGTEIARFLDEGGSVTIRMTADPVPFSALMETAGPEDTVPLLKPVITARPAAAESVFAWESVAAIAEATKDMSPQRKREIADAFATGRGAPRSGEMAAMLYAELAGSGDADAALSAAQLLMRTDAPSAYAMALEAGAGDARGARLILDRVEGGMELADILHLQADGAGEPVEPVADLAVLRRQARAALDGQGARRSYEDALFLSTLAAAAGDRASRHLQDRLAARFSDDPAWAGVVESASNRALKAWTEGGVGAAFAQ